MATDVVPELNAKIEASFKGNVMRDRLLSKISGRIRDGTANLKDAHDYAEKLGENLSKALVNNLTQDTLPNGTLYYNIAQRTIIPNLQTNYKLINEAAEMIQKSLDKKDKIGLGVVKADFPKERISGLIDKMTAEDVEYDRAVKWLGEPIVNNSEAFVDDFVEANCKFRTEAGLKTRIVRKAEAKCCEWCAALEGSYEYGKAPEDIYRRHEFCRCTVTFETEKVSQDVWSKRTWKTSEEDLARRQKYASGLKEPKSPTEVINTANMLYRDAVNSELRKENREIWDAAKKLSGQEKDDLIKKQRSSKKLTPEERIELYKKYQQRRSTKRR